MKKLILLLSIVVVLSACGQQTDLSKINITGRVCSKYNEVGDHKCEWNYVWWAAMNFAWNELKENILKEDVILDTKDKKALDLAKNLNKSIITKKILDEASYYVKSGYGQKTVDLINKESKEKFPQKSFWDLQITLKDKDIISYAYFYKKVEYKEPFDKTNIYFKWEYYKWFEAWNDKQRENVKILNYENDDKFIVKLNLKDNSDELILVKWYDMQSPNEAIKVINEYNKDNLKSLVYNDTYHDFFQAPNIKLDYHRDYEVMIKKRLLNKVLVEQCKKDGLPDNCYEIAAMFENIKFDMDNKWAKVENEAVIIVAEKSMVMLTEKPKYKERNFYLDKDYWIIMKRQKSNIPYFVLWVKNWNLMKK